MSIEGGNVTDGPIIYAAPKIVDDIRDCIFYHTMDLPGHGLVKGAWDIRGRERDYLGRVDFSGKRVLEIGTASGCLCFYMEKQGAEVVAFDLNENYPWDVVPFSGYDHKGHVDEFKKGVAKINNAFWLSHKLFNSKSRVVYGTVYDIPREIGEVDITTFCAVLVHLQNPFAALQNALSLTREKVIVTDVIWNRFVPYHLLNSVLPRPQMTFLPIEKGFRYPDTWWFMSPAVVKAFLRTLGFGKTRVRYSLQKYQGRKWLTYTVVGERTR